MGHHGLEKDSGAAEIVVIVLQGIGHGLSHLGEGGKMDDAVDALRLKEPVHGRPVPDVGLVETGHGVDCRPKAGDQIIGHYHVAAGLDELIYGVGADVAGPTQN